MTFSQRALRVFLLLPILLTSCATSGYWSPPSSQSNPEPVYAPSGGSGAGLDAQAVPEAGAEPEAGSEILAQAGESGIPEIYLTPPSAPAATEPVVSPDPFVTPNPALPPTPTPTSAPVATITADAPPVNTTPYLYYAQAADTLPVVAVRFGVDVSEITSPDPLPESSLLTPGQLLLIPRKLTNTTSSEHLLPDSEIVFSPSSIGFDVEAFAREAGGKLASFREWHQSTGMASGAQIIYRVALENAINPRLLLALLEYQSGWVYGQPLTQDQIDYPLGYKNPNEKGLYNQLIWAMNQISIGYYAWREGRLTHIQFADGVTARLAPDLNAGSAALQYFFAQLYQGQQWLDAVNPTTGFPALYERMLGSPWERALMVEPLFPPGLTQPPLTLPFQRNWTWSFTGGPHGAWEREGSYAALDFAPGSMSPGCVESNAWVVAAASGLVVRSENGLVVVDLDGDGYEQTGWVILYLHVSSDQRVEAGTLVDAGDPLGHPSCEGGISTGTHLHIARKYNGEWIPAYGPLPFNLGGWVAEKGEAAYKGTMRRGDQVVTACTCSASTTFLTRGPDDP